MSPSSSREPHKEWKRDRRAPSVDVAAGEFPPATSSVPEARHWARQVARDWRVSEELVERIAFNVTELASNAVIHARSPFRVGLFLEVMPGPRFRVRVEVTDGSDELPEAMRLAPSATSGRGIAMVTALSTLTGVTRAHSRGKSVWTVIEL